VKGRGVEFSCISGPQKKHHHEQCSDSGQAARDGTNVISHHVQPRIGDGAERGGSLLLVGEAKLDEVRSRLSTVEKSIERSVNPTVYSVEEFRSKLANGNHFLTGVLKGQNVFLLFPVPPIRTQTPPGLASLTGGALTSGR